MKISCVGEWFFHAFEREWIFSIPGPSGRGETKRNRNKTEPEPAFGLGAEKSTQTFFAQSFSTTLRVMHVRAENRGRPHQKVRFPAAPVAGRNKLTPGHSGVRVRNVRGKSGPKSLCLCCFFSPEKRHSQEFVFPSFWRRSGELFGLVVKKWDRLWICVWNCRCKAVRKCRWNFHAYIFWGTFQGTFRIFRFAFRSEIKKLFGATGLRGSEREICLWEGLWDDLWKPSKKTLPLKKLRKPYKSWKTLKKTSKNPAEKPWKPSSDPLRGRFASQRLSVLLPLFICPLNSLRFVLELKAFRGNFVLQQSHPKILSGKRKTHTSTNPTV